MIRRSSALAVLVSSLLAWGQQTEAEALRRLEQDLSSKEYLARLELHQLNSIFRDLRDNPSPATEKLCLSLAGNPEFTALPVRLNFLLPALAAVRPMSERGAALFSRTNENGFYPLNGPLLAANGSARALAVFVRMLSDRRVEAASRVDVIHRSIVPSRTGESLLRTLGSALGGGLEPEIRIAVLESIFEPRPVRFFGRQGNVPHAPAWESATPAARRAAAAIAQHALRENGLPAELKRAMEQFLIGAAK